MRIQSVFKSSLGKYLIWLVIILFCVLAFRMGYALYHNQNIREQFSSALNSSPYQNGVKMEEMDLTQYDRFFPDTFAPIGYSLTHIINNPVTLRYYAEIPNDDSAAYALEIPKGTKIVAIPLDINGPPIYEIGYGYTSYPTHEKGWRYVKPFQIADFQSDPGNQQYYYVKIESLEAVLREMIDANEGIIASLQPRGWSNSKFLRFFLRYVDDVLYQNGVYSSPDLFRPVFDRVNMLLLCLMGIILAAHFLHAGIIRRASLKS